MAKVQMRKLFLQLLFVCLLVATNHAQAREESCVEFEGDGEAVCNAGRIGDGFTSYKCKWCRKWFGFGAETCVAYANPTCW